MVHRSLKIIDRDLDAWRKMLLDSDPKAKPGIWEVIDHILEERFDAQQWKSRRGRRSAPAR